MKIAHIVSHQSPFDKDRLVGVKRMVDTLAQGQVAKGHDVSLIATKGSTSDNVNILETIDPLQDLGISVYDSRAFLYGVVHGGKSTEIINSNNFDIIHNHAEQNFIPYINGLKVPVISTIHGTDFSQDVKYFYKTFRGRFEAIALSNQAIKANDFINYRKVIYNAVDLDEFEFSVGGEDIFWLGRINPKKGVLEAAMVAASTSRKTSLYGYVEPGQESYLAKLNESLESAYVTLSEGYINKEQRLEIMKNSKLFLNPIMWEEPFGLVMIESMACGTPVISFARGSAPEIIKDGETGFLVNTSDNDIRGDFIVKKTGIEGLSEAVEQVYSLDSDSYQKMRNASRRHIEENFKVEKMVDNYVEEYNKIIAEFRS